MFDLKIDLLELNFENATGQEHRIAGIAARATFVLAHRIDDWVERGWDFDSARIETASASDVNLNLSEVTDEQAANDIAAAWLDALTVHLEI
jgi:hypothetical protein